MPNGDEEGIAVTTRGERIRRGFHRLGVMLGALWIFGIAYFLFAAWMANVPAGPHNPYPDNEVTGFLVYAGACVVAGAVTYLAVSGAGRVVAGFFD